MCLKVVTWSQVTKEFHYDASLFHASLHLLDFWTKVNPYHTVILISWFGRKEKVFKSHSFLLKAPQNEDRNNQTNWGIKWAKEKER